MEFDLKESIKILARTPAVLNKLLLDLSPAWTHQNEGENTWSAYDIIGHLIHGEKTDWIPRTEIILRREGDKTFVPFDRFAQFENSKGQTLEELLKTFTQLRAENLQKLDALKLTEQDLLKTGTHPELGTVTLKQLIATWTIHDLSHIHQMTRVMVKLYGDQIGPWKAYSGILRNTI
ncbi:DinB family protein [Fulvivirgaceae bacterium BMA12]|uniref:DinB family protein n=1 Tax=Agaribacillus aureus TaxID=3051825 RepID=A0ABT8L1Q8_9BACT|nr:DinB family protein [Fulvivirgaceae bacterium BMA12]